MIFFPGKKVGGTKRQPVWKEPGILAETQDITPDRSLPLSSRQIIGLVIAAALGIGVWFLLTAPIFRVQQLEIQGEVKPETQAEIEKLKGRNIFLLGGHRAEEKLREQQPSIKRIKIVRGLPDIVRIQVVERDPVLVWKSQDKYYLLDKEGYAYKEAPGDHPTIQSTKQVVDESGLAVNRDQPVVSPDFIEFVRRLIAELPQAVDLKIKDFTVKQSTFQIEAHTEDGPRLLFETSRSLNAQLEALKLVWTERKDQIKEYVDVRVEGYVYYK
ncbi:FtsQ-type POTRA domain-containing protein [Candidatus Berkelbacteria bacterium]|nr:FtsQ-type POTRA domain-containing protein [Candidatus Berkelbacteria bacterium]